MATNVVPYQQQNSLDIQSLIGVGLGKDTSNAFATSAFGLAVRRPDGRYLAKDPSGDRWVDTVATFDFDPYVYRIPVWKLERGNLVVNMDSPLDVMYVLETKDSGARVLNLDSEIVDYAPTRNALFASPFFVRVFSIFDFLGGSGFLGGSRYDRDFGPASFLPFLLCCQQTGSNGGTTGGLDLATVLLLSQGFGGAGGTETGALLPLLLLNNGNCNNSLLPLLLLTSGGKGFGGIEKSGMPALLLLALSNGSSALGGNNNLLLAILLMQGMGGRWWPAEPKDRRQLFDFAQREIDKAKETIELVAKESDEEGRKHLYSLRDGIDKAVREAQAVASKAQGTQPSSDERETKDSRQVFEIAKREIQAAAKEAIDAAAKKSNEEGRKNLDRVRKAIEDAVKTAEEGVSKNLQTAQHKLDDAVKEAQQDARDIVKAAREKIAKAKKAKSGK
jgi:hypothetical protein